MRAIGRSRVPKSTCIPILLTSRARSTKCISILRNFSSRWRKEKHMTASPSTSSALSISVPIWRMPITLEDYPNHDPCVTDEEAALLDFYATETNEVVGGLAGITLAKLERFDRPFRDALRLHTKYDRVTARSRRHLFRYMAQTCKFGNSVSANALCQNDLPNRAISFAAMTKRYQLALLADLSSLVPFRSDDEHQ